MKNHQSYRITWAAAALLIAAAPTPRADASGAGAVAHADHEPRHGGILMMNGDLHYEVVVDFQGRFAIYFSDRHRRPLAEDAVKSASIIVVRGEEEGEKIMLEPSRDGSWAGTGPRIDTSEITVRVTYSTRRSPRPYTIDIAFERINVQLGRH